MRLASSITTSACLPITAAERPKPAISVELTGPAHPDRSKNGAAATLTQAGTRRLRILSTEALMPMLPSGSRRTHLDHNRI